MEPSPTADRIQHKTKAQADEIFGRTTLGYFHLDSYFITVRRYNMRSIPLLYLKIFIL